MPSPPSPTTGPEWTPPPRTPSSPDEQPPLARAASGLVKWAYRRGSRATALVRWRGLRAHTRRSLRRRVGEGDRSPGSLRVGSALSASQKLHDLALSILDAREASIESIEAVTLPAQNILNLSELCGVPALGVHDVAQQRVDVVDVVAQLSHHATALGLRHARETTSWLFGRLPAVATAGGSR